MKYEYNSFESEKLIKLIENKKVFYKNQKNEEAKKFLQREIIFLENEILPIVLKETSIFYAEISRLTTLYYKKASDYNCNGIIVYMPLKSEYEKMPKIGIANCMDLPFGTQGAVMIGVPKFSVYNMDGNTDPKDVECVEIIVNNKIK